MAETNASGETELKSTSPPTLILPTSSSPTPVSPTSGENTTTPAPPTSTTNYGKLANLSPWRRTCINVSLLIGLLFSIMDTSIVSTSLLTISIEFNSLAKTTWVVLAYTLADLSFAIVFSRLSDHLGRRISVVLALSIFTIFSLASGFAQSISQLIAFRFLQGVGGAGMYALALTVIIETATLEGLPNLSAVIGMTVAIAGVLGPVVGGQLTAHVGWRWIFWINGPFCGLAIVLFLIAFPSNTSTEWQRKPFRQFDFIGSVLVLAATVLVVFGLNEGGSGASSWASAITIATLTAGILAWILLVVWQWYCNKYTSIAGAFPPGIWKSRAMAAGFIYTLLAGFIFLTILFALPLRFQLVNQRSPASAGTHLLPFLGSLAFGSFLGGSANSTANRTFLVFCVSSVISIIGCGLFTTSTDAGHAIEGKVYAFEVIVGLGIGMTFSNISFMTTLLSKPDDYAVAQGISASFRVLGGSIGVSAANALFARQCRLELPAAGLSSSVIQQLQQSTSILETLAPPQLHAVRLAYAHAYTETMKMCLGVSVVLLVLAVLTWMKDPPDPRREMREAVLAQQEQEKQQGVEEISQLRMVSFDRNI